MDRRLTPVTATVQGVQVEPRAQQPGSYLGWGAYEFILFEEGSIENMTESLIGNCLQPSSRSRRTSEATVFLSPTSKNLSKVPQRAIVERERLEKFGRPLLGGHGQAEAGVRPQLWSVVYDGLRVVSIS